jgi:hypothetical protein
MSSKALVSAPGRDWIAVVRENGTNEFATAFVAQPLLYASVLNAPCIGVGRIAAFFAATSGMYDTIAFTHETKDGSKTCLEWEGKVFGEDVGGTTILTRDDAELIESVGRFISLFASRPSCDVVFKESSTPRSSIFRNY